MIQKIIRDTAFLSQRERLPLWLICLQHRIYWNQTHFRTFIGWTAQIMQQDIDHCKGIVIWEEATSMA